MTDKKRNTRSVSSDSYPIDFKMLTENVTDVMFIQDMNLNIVYASPSAEKMFGYGASEWPNLRVQDLMTRESYKKGLRIFSKYVKQAVENEDLDIPLMEYQYIRRDGSRFWGELKVDFLRDDEGHPIAIEGVLRDIHHRKEAEKAWTKSRKIFHLFSDQGMLGILVIQDDRVKFANRALSRITGFSQEELQAWDLKNIAEAIHPQDRDFVMNQAQLKQQGEERETKKHYSFRIFSKSGKEKWLEVWSNTIDYENKPANFAVLLDITDRIHAEQKLRTSLQEKQVMIREIHHRVKNNLQVISSLLRLQAEKLDDEKSRLVFDECRHRILSISLVHDKLYQTRDFARINLAHYIRSLTSHLAHSYYYGKHNVQIITNLDEFVVDINRAIPYGLIINELVSNSLRHAFPHQKKGKVKVDMTKKREKHIIRVKDDGIGFPKEVDLFNPNTLGLQLINDLAKQIEGCIELRRDEGTEISVTIPASS